MNIAGGGRKQNSQPGGQHHKADCQNRYEGGSDIPDSSGQGESEIGGCENCRRQCTPHGKQTVQELIGQNQGVSAVPVASTELKGFERVAKKYGVDFVIRKDTSHDPPRYTVFFKARDQAALDAAYREYSAQTLNKENRPSVRKMLNRLIAQTTDTPKKVREKEQERGGR